MKKIIIIFFVSSYCYGDFCDQILNELRAGVNAIPVITKNCLNLLNNQYIISLGIISFIYLSCKDKKSIPFKRSIDHINELNNKKAVEEVCKKMELMDNNCLLFKTLKSINTGMNPHEEFEVKKRAIEEVLSEKDQDKFLSLMYSVKQKKEARDADGIDAIGTNDCILSNILKEIQNEELLSYQDRIFLNFKYFPRYFINLFELTLFLSLLNYLRKNILK